MARAIDYSTSPGGPAGNPATADVMPVVPFNQASHRGLEPGPIFNWTPGASQATFGPSALPAQGYLRRVWLELTATGGAGGVAVASADFPFNLINTIRLQDTNGAPLTELTGYNLFLANTYGVYSGAPDVRTLPDYSANGDNPRFSMFVPVEIAPSGLGCLANQSASAAYKLTVIAASSAEAWATPPSTMPSITLRVHMEYWTLPAATDMLRRPQEQIPPFNGMAQYWSQSENNTINGGANTTRVTRTGGMIRTLIFASRIAGVRNHEAFPTDPILSWDARNLQTASDRLLQNIQRGFVNQLTAVDRGVYVYAFSYGDGHWSGDEGINSWLPTITATRLELKGTSPRPGTIDIIVNDVSVAETSAAARAVETSATGYHPPLAGSVSGAQ